MEDFNARNRASTSVADGTIRQGGNLFAQALEERAKARERAKETLDRSVFLSCCWRILAFRAMREVVQDALGLLVWGELRDDLLDSGGFPLAWRG